MLALGIWHRRVGELALRPLLIMSGACPWVGYPVTLLIVGIYVMTKGEPETALTYVLIIGFLLVGYVLSTFLALKLTAWIVSRIRERCDAGTD